MSATRRWVAALLLMPAVAHANESISLSVSIDPACDPDGIHGDRLGQSLLARLPELRLGAASPTFVLNWQPADAGCELRLRSYDGEHTVPLASDAGLDAIDAAAGQIAWWIATSAATSDEPAPPAVDRAAATTGVAEPPEAALYHRPFVISLWPTLFAPNRPDVPFSTSFGLHIVGSPQAELRGLEVALLGNVLRGTGSGVQVATLFNYTSNGFSGVQVSNVNIVNGPMRGAQVGVVSVALDDLAGAQFATLNFARRVEGAQLGVINVADDVGAQVGVINYAGSAHASLGILTIVRDQPVYFNLGTTERGVVQLGVRHGSRIVQNIYEFEIDPADVERLTAGLGWGTRVGGYRFSGELDLVARSHLNAAESGKNVYEGTQYQLRATAVGRIADRFAVYGGTSFNLLHGPADRAGNVPPWAAEYGTPDDPDNTLRGWVGFHGGLRF